MTLTMQIQCMRSVSVRRGCFGKRCKKESIRQRAPKRFSKKLREVGIRTAVGSSSKNTSAILQAAGLEHHFDVCVDGLDAEALRLPGKPDPVLFLEAARRLDVHPSRIILFEDALAGVEAGERGGFGCVIGIDHGQRRGALRQRGADVVIKNLCEVHVEQN